MAWPIKFRAMLRQARKLKKQLNSDDHCCPNHPDDLLEKEMDILLSELLDPKHKEMIAFQERITGYSDHVFTFLYHQDVPIIKQTD